MSEAVPAGLSAGGAHLWASLLAQDKTLEAESNPARELALEACRTKDRCDMLDALVRASEPVVESGKGVPITNPVWVEARNAGNALKQLIVALRLPDEASGRRPQRQVGSPATRGVSAVRSRFAA
jgi:hypothetical protein